MSFKKLVAILSLSIATSAFAPGAALAGQTYASDQGHTEIRFGWSHAGVSMQHAEFTRSNITLDLADNIEKSSVDVTIDAASLSSGFEALDKHLKSGDFLEVDIYPEITFKSTSISKTGDRTYDLTGNLTMHGVTMPVTFKAEMTHKGPHPVGKFMDYYKGSWIAFRASADIDHMAFKVGSFSTGPISVEINTEMKAK